ncbi:MAG: DNA-binding response regulator, partial [Gallionellales bacterium RIFOXYD2_FULL_52_7]
MIRLFIVDDHAIVRHGLKQLLSMVPDIRVVGEAGCGEELLLALASASCDVLLLDMNMPGLSGVELILQLRANHPVLPILVLSMHIEGQIASRALNAGASGYLTKDNEPEILIDAIRKVYSGGNYIDPVLVETLVFNREVGIPHESLSAREYQVFIM